MEESFIPGPIYFFDQSSDRQRRKRTRKSDKSCKNSSINPQMESNKESTRTKSVSDGESAGDDDLPGESTGKSARKGRCDALLETNDHGNGNDDERCTEAPPAALQEDIYGEICLLEEYRHAAPKLLLELEQLLRLCEGREEGFFPRGLGNVLNYTWRELTDGAVCFIKRQMQSSAHRFIKYRKSKGSVTSDRLSVYTPQEKTKAKKKSRKKTNLEENSLKSLLSTTISFSISSEVCHEQGWVVPSEDLTLGDPQWTALCQWAVERLQLAQILIKEQNAKLAESGFTQPLLLRHYGDVKRDCAGRQRQGGRACAFPPNHRPSIPEPRQEDPFQQKLHYGINDGTSFLYYPSGHVAVCQSHSGLACGGFYTIVFGDAPKASILATFTPFGHGTMAHPISGTVTVWNQCGGVAYDPSGAVTREWTWSPDARQNKPIVVEVTELISVRAWSVTSASLWFRADQERIQLPISYLPNVAPPKNLAEVRSSGVALEPSREEVGCAEPGRRGQVDQDLRRLQRTVRNILEDWLEHYRRATGSTCPALTKAKDRPARSTHSRWKAQSAATPALGPAELEEDSPTQPPGGSAEQLTTARQGKEQPQHVTETGVLRVHLNVRLDPVVTPRGPETGRPAAASPSACPVLTRAAQQGQEGPQQCHCSNRRMPLLTDLEYDTFIEGQPSHTEQVLVVCVTPIAPPTGDALDQLYRAKNKNRSMPCTQCHLDSFRLVRYELPTADSPSGTRSSLLQHRNNIAPGMFLMYAGGRLLFADHIFNGYSCSARDLHKQIAKTREAYRQGHGLPSDFRFSPPVGAFDCADRGLTAPQGPRRKSATRAERHTPLTSILSRKRIPQICDREPAAQDAVASLTLRLSP
ncbi:hypothetical protein SKAU_G00047620 [Synaphobranchus kaupii]|uniref:FAM194 C-terminal domain-containing protein n=1 Tax=Synaphobranchus kaupii TaxID=118154 RepID=A0A9Q1G2E2_SYNKA|nr:hypothetical protein SKAU_G00047620 [Synaphobranchus kaupii]